MRLKELRKKAHVSQEKLAKAIGLKQNNISRYETGEREASYETLIKLADYYGVSLDYIFERTDNPKVNR